MDKVIPYIIYFFVYAFIGYIIESIYCFIIDKKVVNRGFLFGPIIPVFGFGVVTIIFATRNVKDDLFLTFFVSMSACTIIEYFTGWLLEKLFGVKYWDYSQVTKYHLHGRICLSSSLLFGVAGCVIMKLTQPNVVRLVDSLGNYQIIVATGLLFLVALDTIASTYVVYQIKDNVALKLTRGDQTSEIKRLARGAVVKVVTGKSYAERKIDQAKKAAKKKRKEIKQKISNIVTK